MLFSQDNTGSAEFWDLEPGFLTSVQGSFLNLILSVWRAIQVPSLYFYHLCCLFHAFLIGESLRQPLLLNSLFPSSLPYRIIFPLVILPFPKGPLYCVLHRVLSVFSLLRSDFFTSLAVSITMFVDKSSKI